MTANSSTTSAERSDSGISPRKLALTAGLSLLLMVILAPIAHFGLLATLVVPGDGAATVSNIASAEGTFRFAVGALLFVTMLDLLAAWAMYQLLRPGNEAIALLTGWLRVGAAVIFAAILVNLYNVAQLIGTAESSPLASDVIQAQVMSSIAAFDNGWDISLSIFALHLLGMAYLVLKSAHAPRVLAVPLALAGGGYLVQTFGTILVPDFSLSVSSFTGFLEVFLFIWLLWKAARGFGPAEAPSHARPVAPVAVPTTAAR